MAMRRSVFPLLSIFAIGALPARAGQSDKRGGSEVACPSASACLAELRHLQKGEGHGWVYSALGEPQNGRALALASRVLFLGGKSSVDPLSSLLTSSNLETAIAAARLLGTAGKDAAPAFSLLARQLNVRRFKVAAFQWASPRANPAIPLALLRIDADRAFPLLKAASEKGDIASTLALLQIEGGEPVIRKLVASPRGGPVVEALLALHWVGEKRNEILRVAAANDKLPGKLKDAIKESVGTTDTYRPDRPPAEALKDIEKSIATHDEDVDRAKIFRAVAKAGVQSAPLVGRVALLQEQPSPTAEWATWTLGAIPDPAARQALTRSLANDSNWRVPLVAADALAAAGKDPKDGRETLLALHRLISGHWHPGVRAVAETAVGVLEGRTQPIHSEIAEPGQEGSLAHSDCHFLNQCEDLGPAFRCQTPASWGKAVVAEDWGARRGDDGSRMRQEQEQSFGSGSLRIVRKEERDTDPFLRGLEFSAKSPASAGKPAMVANGNFMGVTGRGTQAFVIEVERARDFQAAYGQLVSSGRTWMSRFEFRGGAWFRGRSMELPFRLREVEKFTDGALVLKFQGSLLPVRVTPDGQISAGTCVRDPLADALPGVDIAQALLDDASLVKRLLENGAPMPLRISFHWEVKGAERLTFNGHPVVVESDEMVVDAGRTLEFDRVFREHGEGSQDAPGQPLDTVSVGVVFPALDLDIFRQVTLEAGRWRALPEVKNGKGVHPLPPPPVDVKAPPPDARQAECGLSFKVLSPAVKDPLDDQVPGPNDSVSIEFTEWTAAGATLAGYHPQADHLIISVPLAIALGGLTDGLRMMKISESRRLWVPAGLANPAGASDQPDLVFDVTLKHIARVESEELDPSDDEMKPLGKLRTPPKSAKKTPSGLTFIVLKTGGKKPQTPSANDIVILNYAGYTEDGRLFDSSYLRSAGRRGVGYDGVIPALLIPGLAEGIPLMRAGEKRRFWIPSKLAHGPSAAGRGLPEGNLIVDVEVGRFD